MEYIKFQPRVQEYSRSRQCSQNGKIFPFKQEGVYKDKSTFPVSLYHRLNQRQLGIDGKTVLWPTS